MDHFSLKNGELHAEGVPLSVIAEAVGTPVYVYSRATLIRHARVFRDAFSALPRIHLAYAMKANPNLAVLRVLAGEGYGADIVSGGELERALAAGMPAADVVFSGVGKDAAELRRALEVGLGQFNLESEEEGAELAAIAAAMGKRAVCTLRVNPDVDAGTHAKISTGKADNKFGVAYDCAGAIYARLAALPGLEMRGLAVHIGVGVLYTGVDVAVGTVVGVDDAMTTGVEVITGVDVLVDVGVAVAGGHFTRNVALAALFWVVGFITLIFATAFGFDEHVASPFTVHETTAVLV